MFDIFNRSDIPSLSLYVNTWNHLTVIYPMFISSSCIQTETQEIPCGYIIDYRRRGHILPVDPEQYGQLEYYESRFGLMLYTHVTVSGVPTIYACGLHSLNVT